MGAFQLILLTLLDPNLRPCGILNVGIFHIIMSMWQKNVMDVDNVLGLAPNLKFKRITRKSSK
jgi:hypothetical protein